MNSEVGSTGALLQVEPAPGPKIQICRGGGAGRVFHPICLDPGYPSIPSFLSKMPGHSQLTCLISADALEWG